MARIFEHYRFSLDYGGGNRMTGIMLRNLGWNGSYDVSDLSDVVDPEYKDLNEVKKTEIRNCSWWRNFC